MGSHIKEKKADVRQGQADPTPFDEDDLMEAVSQDYTFVLMCDLSLLMPFASKCILPDVNMVTPSFLGYFLYGELFPSTYFQAICLYN